ncbi:DNA-binding response OmpR family regulator [Paraburkholderia sp. RAU2J]|uniref:response regulator transcription factor n=1 Tax=Paraburkholderia sp. RAU2J TaxID=1938810 RepID=UPI000EB06F41|nr:response regulator transcription factor [Paraburkholderia sp. RAU2J]RKT13481.1 DNA-binding response OmpR family regulator [Paraburkholderia sp. RAU2J]
MRIAVLDDEPADADYVCRALSTERHVCYAFSNGNALIQQLRRQSFDLLVLDWNVPGVSGEEVLRWVRENLSERLPVLFLTARGEEVDIARVLNLGADDYVVKPVPAGVLLARVEALLRRAYLLDRGPSKAEFDDVVFDLATAQAVVRGTPVALKRKEFDLALLLFQHLNRPLSRAHIQDVIWKTNVDVPSRTMDTHVSSLRTKLGLRPEHGYRVTPIYGYGYRLEKIGKAADLA